MMTDPIADMLTRIRNAHLALHKEVSVPSSKTVSYTHLSPVNSLKCGSTSGLWTSWNPRSRPWTPSASSACLRVWMWKSSFSEECHG